MADPTYTLSIGEMRARIVLEAITGARTVVRSIEEVAALPRLTGWGLCILETAVCDLIATGRLGDDAHGQLVLAPRGRPT